ASRGRISNGPYGVDGAALATQGVLTRTVADTALGLDVLSGPWPGDDRNLPRPERGFLGALMASAGDRDPRVAGLKIGVLLDPISGRDTRVHAPAMPGPQ